MTDTPRTLEERLRELADDMEAGRNYADTPQFIRAAATEIVTLRASKELRLMLFGYFVVGPLLLVAVYVIGTMIRGA